MIDLNFRINKNAFYNALTTVSHAISSNSPVPALTGILIEVKDNSIILTGSDSDVSIQMNLHNTDKNQLDLNITGEGSIVIDARYLLDMVKKIDSDEISVETIDGTLTKFEGNKAVYRINGFRPEDYPTMDFARPDVSIEMDGSAFSEMVSSISFAASSKETRPVLTGINLKEEGDKLICTATDSYRLARKTMSLTASAFSVTVPARSMNEAKSIFGEDDKIHIALNNKKIQFYNDDILLQSSLLEGGYPETERLIPKEYTRTLVINRMAFLSALDRTSFIKTDNMTVIRMQINSKDDIVMSAKSQEIGDLHEDLTAVSYEGEPLDISFSGAYAVQAARALTTENIRISFTGEMKPFVMKNENGDNSIMQLVLPVRTYN